MADVDINFSLSKEDLSCCICYDDIPFPLIRCTNSFILFVRNAIENA